MENIDIDFEELFTPYVPSEYNIKRREYARRKTAMFGYVIEGQEQDIENYDKAKAADFKGFVVHHRLEEQGYTMKQLKEMGLYYRRPANELIFLTHKEHAEIHKTIRKEKNMSYDFEKYNDGKPFDFCQEKWMEEAVKDGIKCAKDKLTLKESGIEKISKETLAKNVELLKSLDKEFIYWVGSEQQLLDIGIDKDFLAWAEYHDVIGWWKNKQKFFINMDTLISMKEFSDIIE